MSISSIPAPAWVRQRAEIGSAAADLAAAFLAQAARGLGLGLLAAAVVVSVAAVLIGLTHLGIGVGGPAIPPQLLRGG